MARETLKELDVLSAYRESRLVTVLGEPMKRCARELNAMMSAHDQAFYQGAGEAFLRGPYLQDLPRAILKRVGPELERRSQEDLRTAAEARAERERYLSQQKADAEKRDAERKLEMARLESDRRAEELKIEETKRQRLEAAQKANGLLKDRMYECTKREVTDMVRSGEGAEVLANAAMTICNQEVDRALEGFVGEQKIETGRTIGAAEAEGLKAAARNVIRESVVASAVKAKANRPGATTY